MQTSEQTIEHIVKNPSTEIEVFIPELGEFFHLTIKPKVVEIDKRVFIDFHTYHNNTKGVVYAELLEGAKLVIYNASGNLCVTGLAFIAIYEKWKSEVSMSAVVEIKGILEEFLEKSWNMIDSVRGRARLVLKEMPFIAFWKTPFTEQEQRVYPSGLKPMALKDLWDTIKNSHLSMLFSEDITRVVLTDTPTSGIFEETELTFYKPTKVVGGGIELKILVICGKYKGDVIAELTDKGSFYITQLFGSSSAAALACLIAYKTFSPVTVTTSSSDVRYALNEFLRNRNNNFLSIKKDVRNMVDALEQKQTPRAPEVYTADIPSAKEMTESFYKRNADLAKAIPTPAAPLDGDTPSSQQTLGADHKNPTSSLLESARAASKSPFSPVKGKTAPLKDLCLLFKMPSLKEKEALKAAGVDFRSAPNSTDFSVARRAVTTYGENSCFVNLTSRNAEVFTREATMALIKLCVAIVPMFMKSLGKEHEVNEEVANLFIKITSELFLTDSEATSDCNVKIFVPVCDGHLEIVVDPVEQTINCEMYDEFKYLLHSGSISSDRVKRILTLLP